ncbi:unnamed protein product [Sphagnum balticum]
MRVREGEEECMRVQPFCYVARSCVPTLSKQKKKRFSFSNGAKISKEVEHTVAEMREEEQQQPENANSFTLGVSEGAGPEHLVVLVNGIVGSVENWRFAAEQFKKKLADKVVVHCNACNSALRTFNGVDVMGNRLAEEVPFLFGISTLERVAPMISHWFIGRTGRHLFLADGNKTLQPLLQRIVTDCHEGRFMSALRAFKQRTAYANTVYDHIVGWRTASIRRESEMPQVDIRKALDPAYPHIVRDEELPAVDLKPTTMQTREPASDFAEEVMLTGLQQVAWRRVDVSFSGARVKNQAHNTIQVKSAAVHLEGQDVIAHIIDKHF